MGLYEVTGPLWVTEDSYGVVEVEERVALQSCTFEEGRRVQTARKPQTMCRHLEHGGPWTGVSYG